jgi:hypothetical protein
MTQRVSNQLFLENDINLNELIKIINISDSMTIPLALVSYANRMLYRTYSTLEDQLEGVRDPETFKKLDTLTQSVFDAWVALDYQEGGEL